MLYLLSSPFSIIFVIVVLVWLSKLSNRVKKLEAMAAKGEIKLAEKAIQADAIPAVSNMPLSSTGEPIKAYAVTPEVPASVFPVSTKAVKSESGEDAGGRILGKVGIIALFAGVAFFLKYAFDSGLIGPMGRIVLGFLGGIALFAIGHILRKNHAKYSEILMGGGIAILYLTTFFAYAFYGFMEAGAAYSIMFIITALSAVVSMVNKSPVVATMGIIGGFITPLLMSQYDAGMHATLTYTLIMDLGVMWIAYAYKWIHLNYIAFVGTIFTILPWTYGNNDETTVFAFATAFFVLFLIASMFHHVVRKEKSNGADIGLITLNGCLYALISYTTLYDSMQELFSAYLIGLALIYFVAGYLALLTNKEDKALNFALPSLTVLFLTLAVPVALSGPWITVAWLTEGLILYSLVRAIQGHQVHVFGFIVYLVGMIRVAIIEDVFDTSASLQFFPIFNERMYILLFALFITFAITYLIWRNRDLLEGESAKTLVAVFFVFSQAMTVFIITTEINLTYGKQYLAENTINQRQYTDCIASYGSTRDCPINYSKSSTITNTRNTVVSIVWALYAVALILIGLVKRVRMVRTLGLIFLLLTVFKVFVDVWSLGQLYRIISSIVVGVIALGGSFLYSKFKSRLHDVL